MPLPAINPREENYSQGMLAVQLISGNANFHNAAATPFRGMAFTGDIAG